MNATPLEYMAFDKEKKVMVKVDGINFALNHFWGQELETHLKHDYSLEPYILIMFTGMYDNKGKKIWESDLVDTGTMFGVQEVIWCPKVAGFIFGNCNGKQLKRDMQNSYEKRGNKYLNPELVKKYKL